MNNDKIQQCSNFHKRYRQFTLSLDLDQREELSIIVESNESNEIFEKKIDKKIIASDQNFDNIFFTPADIIEFVCKYDDYVIVKKDEIVLEYPLNKKKFKNIRIGLEKRVEGKKEDGGVANQLREMRRQFQRLVDKIVIDKDKRIQVLERKVKANEQKMVELQRQMEEMSKITAETKNDIKNQQGKQKKIRYEKTESDKFQQNPRKEQQPTNKKTPAQSKNQPPNEYPKQKQRPEQIPTQKLGSHPQNAHKEHFKIEPFYKFILVTRSTESAWYNFTNHYEIINQQISFFVKIKRILRKFICIGFGTKKSIGLKGASQPQGAFYLCNGTFIEFEKNKMTKSEAFVADTIEATFSPQTRSITWRKNNRQIQTCPIPPKLQNTPFYFMLLMCDKDDEVEISTVK